MSKRSGRVYVCELLGDDMKQNYIYSDFLFILLNAKNNMKSKLLIMLFFALAINPVFAQAPDWQWAKKAGGSSFDNVTDIAVDTIGNTYVTGYFVSPTITFGGITLINSAAYEWDFFIAKYDASGSVIWAKRVGGNMREFGKSIAVDKIGNCYVTGAFNSPSITIGSTILYYASSDFNMFIVKYDANGNVIWAKSAGGDSEGRGIAVDGNGNSYVTGFFRDSHITFGSTTLIDTVNVNNKIFIVKYDSSGNLIWAKKPMKSGSGYANKIAVDGAENSYIIGNFSSTAIFFGNDTLINNGGSNGTSDLFIIKCDTSGTVLWSKSAEGLYSDFITGIAVDSSGNSYVAGSYDSPTITFGSTLLINNSTGADDDMFIVKYDTNGSIIWAKSVGGTYDDIINDVSIDGSGNIYTTGFYSNASINFGGVTLTNNNGLDGYSDIFLVKYDTSGSVVWGKSVGGSNYDGGSGVDVDANGNCYVAGNFVSPSINFGGTTITNTTTGANGAGWNDIFIWKLCNNSSALPTVTSNGTTTFCLGNSVTLTANNANSYLWTNTSITQSIIASSTGNYSVIETEGNGCAAISATTTVTVNPLPLISLNLSNVDTLCINVWFVNLSGVYPAGGVFSGAGVVGNTFSPGTAGVGMHVITYTYTDGNGCIGFATDSIFVHTCSEINELINDSDITISPNPFNTKTNISFSQEQKNSTVKITDVLGKEIKIINFTGKELIIEKEEMQSGIYFINIKTDRGIVSKKLIISK